MRDPGSGYLSTALPSAARTRSAALTLTLAGTTLAAALSGSVAVALTLRSAAVTAVTTGSALATEPR